MTDTQQPELTEDGRQRRTIKSFVMRAGRMTEGQQRGLDKGWPLFGLELEDGLRDFDQVFGRSAPRTFEIGFGMGHSTLEMAAAAPEHDFIGVEVHKPGVGALLNGVMTQNLSNLRVYSCDALEVLRDCVADASLDRVLLFFPDPWHKVKHHKRRLVAPGFPEIVRAALAPGGALRLATDWEDYALQMREVLDAADGFERGFPGEWAERFDGRVETAFERKGARAGRDIRDLVYRAV
ncbi:MAG TPA: tRNA (guanosine(46)-N7)-methyltransferase TrmB [Microbacterium ginsengisoli]|uniref:tRNA (guanine-N(7)-)-methyltransferase n=1 Tax=Microbacterium ginsengisoli TaxID=400772 RepID=A0A3C1KD28_9MICO|nr:tRNA (guanosine(46)-N7)-methyltransferase TrmB [Microbacterium ginsengisoli]